MAKSKVEKEVEAKALAAEAEAQETTEEKTEVKAEVKEEAKKEVVFNRYVKYGKTSVPAGQKFEIDEKDYDELVEAGVIEE